MVRVMVKKAYTNDMVYVELAGLSDDDKPVGGGMITGSRFIEADTGKVFMYNETAAEWNQITAGYTPETPAEDAEDA